MPRDTSSTGDVPAPPAHRRRTRALARRALPFIGLVLAIALFIVAIRYPGRAPSRAPASLPATSAGPSPTSRAEPVLTPTIGCPHPPAPTLESPALAVRVPEPRPAAGASAEPAGEAAAEEPAPGAPGPAGDSAPVPSLSGGILDLPVPYDGSAATFRRLVNRSSLGGLITSYFDHEYPLYPWVWHGFSFGGGEPPAEPAGNSVLAYDGARLGEDWYTGHVGFDLAPLPGQAGDTPILAAAEGRIESALVQSDGNHVVQLRHAVPGLGEFLTIYMHLQADDHFVATSLRTGGGIARGGRIGTMGSTGKSTGVHLHFEVRYDRDGDGAFDRHERVDPFGYVPLEAPDPWAQDASWIDAAGRPVHHRGIASPYLWRHPLGAAATVGESGVALSTGQGGGDLEMTACVEPGALAPGSTLLVAWAPDPLPEPDWLGTGHGCLVYAQDAAGATLPAFSDEVPVTLAFSSDDIRDVDPATLQIQLYNADTGAWEGLDTALDLARGLAQARFPRPGRCALRGRPLVDRLAPRTEIALSAGPDAEGYHPEPLAVTLTASDQGGAGVAVMQYSLDFGATWQPYTAPFALAPAAAAAALPAAAAAEEGEDVLRTEPGEQVILAASEDAAGNREFPPAIARVFWRTPAPEVRFRADPPAITPPCCATLTWEVSGAEEATLDGEAVPRQGSREICPESTRRYTLRARSALGGETVAPLEVEARPLEILFQAAPPAVLCGRATTVRWEVSPGAAVTLDGEPVAAAGSLTTCLNTPHVYTLSAGLPCGQEVTRILSIPAHPMELAFWADPPEIQPCGCTTLRWQVAEADRVTLDGEPVTLEGSREACPGEGRTYTLRAETGCCTPAEAHVTVRALPPPVVTFSADRTTLKPGEPVTLQWAVDGIQAVYLDGSGVGGHDSRTFAPRESHIYTLRVVWACGEIVREIHVAVEGDARAPLITLTTTAAPNYCPYPLRLSARVVDESPLASVRVRYIVGDPGTALPSEWLPMACCEPDGDWYRDIPYTAGIHYEIEATDSQGNTAYSPITAVTCYP